MMPTYTQENTILCPRKTAIRIEGWLRDTDYIADTNKDGVYEFSFQPLTSQDHQRLFEVIEQAKMEVMMNAHRFSNKQEPTATCEDRTGTPYCSQLFAPKLNVEVEHPDFLREKQVSLALHLRDDVVGRIYLQADYVDVYSPSNGIDEEETEEEVVFDDW